MIATFAWLAEDHSYLEKLIDEYQSRVFNTAISYLQNAEDAEEITQDVFLEVHRSMAYFRGDAAVSTWIYRITVNKCLDLLRYRKRQKRSGIVLRIFGEEGGRSGHDLPHFEHPGIVLEKKEDARILFRAIEQLPENQKTAFLLSQVEQLPQKEIAAIMELSEKAVESLIQRAKSNLRTRLEEFYPRRRKS